MKYDIKLILAKHKRTNFEQDKFANAELAKLEHENLKKQKQLYGTTLQALTNIIQSFPWYFHFILGYILLRSFIFYFLLPILYYFNIYLGPLDILIEMRHNPIFHSTDWVLIATLSLAPMVHEYIKIKFIKYVSD